MESFGDFVFSNRFVSRLDPDFSGDRSFRRFSGRAARFVIFQRGALFHFEFEFERRIARRTRIDELGDFRGESNDDFRHFSPEENSFREKNRFYRFVEKGFFLEFVQTKSRRKDKNSRRTR